MARKRKDNNIRVGLTGSYTYENQREIRETIFKLRESFGSQLEIISRGNQSGADKYIKKYASEFGVTYWEFTFQFTEKYKIENLYTKFHAKTRWTRDKAMSKYIDYLIIFRHGEDKDQLIDYTKKLNKKVVIL